MARVKRAVHSKKHRRAVLEQAQGYFGNKSRSYRAAHEQVMHSMQYAYRDRRARKGDFRQLWIQRINAGRPRPRHELQPAHRRPESRRRRGRPQDPGRPRRARRGRLPDHCRGRPNRAGRSGGLRLRGIGDRLNGPGPDHNATSAERPRLQKLTQCSACGACPAAPRRAPGGRRALWWKAPSWSGRRSGWRRHRRRVRRPRGRRAGRELELAAACARAGARVRELQPGVLSRACDAVTPQPLAAIVRAVDVPLHSSARPATGSGRGLRPGCATPATWGHHSQRRRRWRRAVVCCAGSVDLYNPKTVRASAGALFHLPVVAGPDATGGGLTQLGAWGLRRWGASARGERVYTDVDLARPAALVLGNESAGPGETRWVARLDGTLRIPMAGDGGVAQRGHHRGRGVLRGGPAAGHPRGRGEPGVTTHRHRTSSICYRTRSWCWTGPAASPPSTTPPAV